MRPHHRTPSIFNISMVDMLCCSLGCVILLWLIKADKVQEMQADTEIALTSKNEALDELRQKMAGYDAELAGKDNDLADARRRLAGRGRDLEDAKNRLAGRERDLAAARKNLAGRDDDLAVAARDAAALRVKLQESKALAAESQHRLLTAEDMIRLLNLLFEDARTDAEARKARLGELEKILAALKDQKKELADRLNNTTINLDELQKKLAAAEVRTRQLTVLANQVPELKDDVKKYRDRAANQQALTDLTKAQLETRNRELAEVEKKLDAVLVQKTNLERSLTTAQGFRDQLTLSDERFKKLQKDYDEKLLELSRARRDLGTVERENNTLVRERDNLRRDADRLQHEADNRFAGISLTGNHVVFIVDMSGSMDYVDEDTRSPTKWRNVCDSVRKILLSLPRPEKIQVIAFSDKVSYPLVSEGKWLDYDSASTPDLVYKTLRAIQPRGGTNMYAALEAAFRYRELGLDAVYFLSDGLANQGPGLTEEQTRKLGDQEKGEILGKHIRKKLLTDWNREMPNRPRVPVNTVGFFFESPDVGAFLWAMSRENKGSFVGMSEP